ncbi:Sulfotransferase family protein [Paraburkholderia sabiae]|uniref:sulfotransferase family protein n=1 Tax=Paraburkholderia sabiae TaxID=273251 RepID=UPI001CAE3859|nr:sulfotransferase [Paraburkholderia sabiae]CAG9213064.1 Sulfotransferase family protein [Paraburkholderia sabiae]
MGFVDFSSCEAHNEFLRLNITFMFRNVFRRRSDKISVIPKFTPLFVAGAPRSGTTILHAIICASQRTNGYISECSYFTALLHPLLVGLDTFDVHTKYHFSSRDAFITHHAEILRKELYRIWQYTGSHEVLALKDPMLTALIPQVAKILPESKYIVSIRDPRATISSRIEVRMRETQGQPVTDAEVKAFCAEYVHMYGTIANSVSDLEGRILLVDYRDVVSGRVFDKLATFDLGNIETDAIWADTIADPTPNDKDPWTTALHGKKPSVASIDRYREVLESRTEQLIMDACGPVAQVLGAI